ncbi:sensor histidine kinase [Cohnella algarum]|uniref:sensor histidine kinase n=1 Tax=Cohnella algarum TaxID=2044859 RepID=UPI0019684693|nr:HAMP domain-containing sensor histidine kinase [Cohnella algarum]MBN2979862.1 HAMP domain-containing histidine kinase [Cohnella algarum]
MSIRLRLTLWFSGLLALTMIAFGFLVYYVVSLNTMQELKGRLQDEAKALEPYISPNRNGIGFDLGISVPRDFDYNMIGIQVVSYLQDREGTVSRKSFAYGTDLAYPAKKDAKSRYTKVHMDGSPFYVFETPITLTGSTEIVGLLQVAGYIGKEESMLLLLRTILVLTGVAALLVAFMLGMFLSRKALQPIEQVTAAAERIQSGSDLSTRIPGDSQDEIGRLRSTLNHMLERLETAYKGLEESNIAQRRFVSDASHELRTPLTTIRGNVDFLAKVWEGAHGEKSQALTTEEREQLSKEAIHDIADEARRMSRLVNDLLALARADAGSDVPMERLSLRPLAEEAARRAAFLPRNAEWIVGPLEALDGVWVKGNRDYLLQLLFIFIENGFKYTPSGEVRLEAVRSEDRVGLVVADTGIGMSKEEVPHIFDRFYRADESRGKTSGTGLGLSIAKWIADMHNASLEVRTKLGEGSRFFVWFPVDFSEPAEYDIIEPTERPRLPEREES